MDGENFVPAQHYQEIANTAELPSAAALLGLLAVGDQQGHNQYLQRKEVRPPGGAPIMTKHSRLIDMGQMFGHWAWSAATHSACHAAYALPGHMAAHLTWGKLQPTIDEIAGAADGEFHACFEDCPEEWAVPAADRAAGSARVIVARDSLAGILRTGNPGIR